MKKRVAIPLLVSAAVMLAGCVAGSPLSNYANGERSKTVNDVMQNWVGHSETELVSAWGPPLSAYQNRDGSVVAKWDFYTGKSMCGSYFLIDPQGVIRRWKYDYCYANSAIEGEAMPASTPIPQSTM